MKKILLSLSIILASTRVLATDDSSKTIMIGASSMTHAEMLAYIQPTLAKQGYHLKISEFSDYITPNIAVTQKHLDANFFQHLPYLIQYNKDHNTNLVSLVAVFIAPMGIYANPTSEAKFISSKKVSDIPTGSKIGVPNDPTNEGRALLILQANNIIKLKGGVAYPTKRDITANPYNVRIVELDAAMLTRSLSSQQVDLAVINSNYALSAHLEPSRDAILLENSQSPFANIVAVRPDEINEPKMKALAKALTSPEMKQFMLKKYHGDLIPSF